VDSKKYVLTSSEKAKALLFGRKFGTLTTININTNKENTVPLLGSIKPYILHPRWYCSPILSIRKDDIHYNNIAKYTKTSLLVFPLTPKHILPSTVPLPRINILGNLSPITQQNDIQLILQKYNEEFPGSIQYLQEPDVFHYEMKLCEIHFYNTSGRLELISTEEFIHSPDDPIAPISRKIIEKVNDKMAKQLIELCKSYGEIEVSEAFVFALDRLGFDILGKDTKTESWYCFRMPLENPITNIDDYEMTMNQSLKSTKKS